MKSPLGLCQLPRTRRSPRPGVCGRDGLGLGPSRCLAWRAQCRRNAERGSAIPSRKAATAGRKPSTG